MRRQEYFRYLILASFLVLFSFFSVKHFVLGGGSAASVDALCPFGGFESFFTFITTGLLVPRIMASSMILALAIILVSIIFSRGFCGWICPFGTVQEFLGKLSKRKVRIPEKTDSYLRYLKYLVLAVIIVGTAITGTLIFRGYDPFMTFFHFGKGLIWEYSPDELPVLLPGIIITAAVLAASVFIERFWCRYLCPLGAVTALFSRLRISKIKRDKKTCINCKACDKVCPSLLKPSTVEEVKSAECIGCTRCVNACPKNSLSINIGKKKIGAYLFASLLIIAFFSVIMISMALGYWQSVPEVSDIADEHAGTINVDDIKGWMTLAEVSEASGIPLDEMVPALGLPQDIDSATPLKDIAAKYSVDFDTENVREYLKDHQEGCSSDEDVSCPWGEQDDPAPGDCGLYDDNDDNGICDKSQ